MANSLLTGVSGLIAHQRMLNIVGNNLANMNTIGFKSQRVRFADLVYETIRPAASGSNNDAGGVNPNQVGSGVKVSQVDRNFAQGSIELSGGLYDVAIQGQGFFVLNDGTKNVFTRAGAFAIDRQQNLVDPATGLRVIRTGTLGEGDGVNPQFQTPGDNSIRIPYGAVIPGAATTAIDISGNLNSKTALNALPEIVATNAFGDTLTSAPATAATLLNNLGLEGTGIDTSVPINFSGINHDGSAIGGSFTATATSTIGDLLVAINSQLGSQATATIADGKIVVTSEEPGISKLQFSISSGDPEKFKLENSFASTQRGRDATEVSKEIQVVDVLGVTHPVKLTFKRLQNDREWDVFATTDDGTVIDGKIGMLQFDEMGKNARILGVGTDDPFITLHFDGNQSPQTIELNFAASGEENGLFQVGQPDSIAFTQDGYPPGVINSVSIGLDGTIQGVASNGTSVPIAQMAVAFFENEKGLLATGDNYYVQSLNSGDPQIGEAGSGSRGFMQGGSLETANVDVALEFTQLIIAQRGFSANARTITVSSEVLEELTNIVR